MLIAPLKMLTKGCVQISSTILSTNSPAPATSKTSHPISISRILENDCKLYARVFAVPVKMRLRSAASPPSEMNVSASAGSETDDCSRKTAIFWRPGSGLERDTMIDGISETSMPAEDDIGCRDPGGVVRRGRFLARLSEVSRLSVKLVLQRAFLLAVPANEYSGVLSFILDFFTFFNIFEACRDAGEPAVRWAKCNLVGLGDPFSGGGIQMGAQAPNQPR